jgi:protocatechuate 3,4-dioxygenase beta subunit
LPTVHSIKIGAAAPTPPHTDADLTGSERPRGSGRRINQVKRRQFVTLLLVAPVPLVVALGSTTSTKAARQLLGMPGAATAQGTALAPTPECADADDVTPRQTEGPYFTPNSPERTSLLEGNERGTPIVLSGQVVDTACQPITGALLDFWQADDTGQYDNVGYRMRGHQFTDETGAYRLETIVPALYPGRTRHVHVKVQAPNQPVLTTQLYFPNEPANARDGIFRPELVMQVADTETGKSASFTFVLQLA